MPKLKEKYLADVQNRISSSSNNLLAMAAPLESSTSTKGKASGKEAAETTKKVEQKDAPAQKPMMVIALLSVGVLRPALSLLGVFPWLVDVHREIADLILQIMKTSLQPLWETHFMKERNKRNPSFMQPRARYAAGGVTAPPPRRHQLTLISPTPPSTHTNNFVFFFPNWVEWVPLCHSLDDIGNVIEPLMGYVGLHASRQPLFLTKLLRLGKMQLASTVCATNILL